MVSFRFLVLHSPVYAELIEERTRIYSGRTSRGYFDNRPPRLDHLGIVEWHAIQGARLAPRLRLEANSARALSLLRPKFFLPRGHVRHAQPRIHQPSPDRPFYEQQLRLLAD